MATANVHILVSFVHQSPSRSPFVLLADCICPFLQTFLDKDEVTSRVVAVLKNFEKVDPTKVTPTAHFVNDLGLDSLDIVEVCMALEEEFVITIADAEAEKIFTVEDAVNFVATHPNAM